MAVLAKAEKAQLMTQSLKMAEEARRVPSSESDRKPVERETESYSGGVGQKRTNNDRDDFDAKKDRDNIRAQRRREIVREDRMERAGVKKSKAERDGDRDISEKIALGMAQPTSKGEAMFDQRLFNQTAGLGTGFGHDEDYNLYDKPLFADRTAASIYKGIKTLDDAETEQVEDKSQVRVRKVLGQGETKEDEPNVYAQSSRSKPVEFEKTVLIGSTDEPGFKAGLQK